MFNFDDSGSDHKNTSFFGLSQIRDSLEEEEDKDLPVEELLGDDF